MGGSVFARSRVFHVSLLTQIPALEIRRVRSAHRLALMVRMRTLRDVGSSEGGWRRGAVLEPALHVWKSAMPVP